MSNEEMKINSDIPVCDTREPVEIYEPLLRLGWQKQTLDVGDYQIYDSTGEVVLIERKTLSQFLADLGGPLQRQCRKLVETSDFPILLLEGHWDLADGYLLGTHFTWCSVWNALASLQDIGCRLQFTTSVEHTLARLLELKQYYSKEYHASISRHPAGDARISVLNQIPGIGANRARAILERLPTLKQVANAGIDELEQAEGVGRKLAVKINKFWGVKDGHLG